jgi:integrase
VPLAPILRGYLVRHRLACGRNRGLVFGVDARQPFSPSAVRRRAEQRWKSAGLKRITPHEARHTCACMLIAAGVNPKVISTFMGHSSIKVTFDIYGKLMPGSESVAAILLEDYLEEAG